MQDEKELDRKTEKAVTPNLARWKISEVSWALGQILWPNP